MSKALSSRYEVTIPLLTEDAYKRLTHPELVREQIAVALENGGSLQEGVDFEVEVRRVYVYPEGIDEGRGV